MENLSNRYAESLFLESQDKKVILSYLKDLSKIYEMADFKSMMDSPRIKNEEKLSVICEILKPNELFKRFLNLLIKEERFPLIGEIAEKYEEMFDKENKVLNILISSSLKLSEDDINKILKKYKDLYQANEVTYKEVIDKSLIGGVKVTVNGVVYDGTVRTKFNEML